MNRQEQTPPFALFLLCLLLLLPIGFLLLRYVENGFLYVALLVVGAYWVVPAVAFDLAQWMDSQPQPMSVRQVRRAQRVKRVQDAWNAVVLPEATKRELMTLQRILEDPRGYRQRWGLEPPLGAILHGPPGTGKTMIARTLAQSAGYSFLAPSPAELNNMWVGESEKAIQALYQQARASAPCVVFLDELDTLAAHRSGTGNDRGGAVRNFNNATNQLLQEIDGFRGRSQVFTVGATNRLDILDAAITSRLGMHVYVGLPDTAALENLFRLYTWTYRERLDVAVEVLACSASGMSGRDVQEVCKLAAMNAEGRGRDRVGLLEFGEAFSRRGFTLSQPGVRSKRSYAHQAK